jgi:hypothetical protein
MNGPTGTSRSTGMRRVLSAAASGTVATVVCLLLAACGGDGGEPGGGASAGASASSPPVSLSPARRTPPPFATPPASPDGGAGTVTVSGTVEAGVEPNCLVLNGYLLVGGRDEGVRAGARVTVTGQARPDLVTTCQQGTPLQVETVRPG